MTDVKTIEFKTINLDLFKGLTEELQSSETSKQVFEALNEAGLNPRNYDAGNNGFVPFLLHITIQGELKNFLNIVKDNESLVASVFKVLHPSYLAELVDQYKRAYGLQKARIETKMLAIGHIARNTTKEEQNRMITAFENYNEDRQKAINEEKAKQAVLLGGKIDE